MSSSVGTSTCGGGDGTAAPSMGAAHSPTAGRPARVTGSVRSRRIASVVGAVLLCAWCGWVSGFHRRSTAAECTWVVSLAFVVAAAVLFGRGRRGARFGWSIGTADEPWPRAGRGGGGPAWRGVAPWLGVLVVGVAWDALGIDTGPRTSHLTISALSQALRPLNALLLLVWMLAGIGYAAARARAPAATDGRDASAGRRAGKGWRDGAALYSAGSVPGHAVGSGHPLTPALLLPSDRTAGVAFWLGLLVVAVGVDLLARRSAGRMATAEELVRFISTATLANIALIAAWMFAGYHLFAR
jgi:hypothetical protein